jgi:hypothetical protein
MENMLANTNNQPTLPQMLLNNLKNVAISALDDEYQTEKRMIDDDPNMTTSEKISARRQSSMFYVGCTCFLLITAFIVAPYLR